MAEKELTKADLEAARKLVRYYDVHEGDRVLITRDSYVEPLVTEAIGRVCREQGAIVFDLLMPNPRIDLRDEDIDHSHEFFFRGVEGVDLWISTDAGRTAGFIPKALTEYGTVMGQTQCYSLEHLRSEIWRFPMELQVEFFKRTVKLLEGKRELRITSPSGTDFTAIIPPGKLTEVGDGGQMVLRRPGNWMGFPGGCFAFFTETSNGVHVIDYFSPIMGMKAIIDNPFTDRKNPMVITVENGRVADVKGDLSKELVEYWEKSGNNAFGYVAAVMVGICPKGYPIGWPKAEPIQWYFPFHYSPLVSWLWLMEDSFPRFMTAYNYKPTWTVDGEVVLQNGRFKFVDDPDLKEIAARFGDPDELLKTIPFPPEMFDEGPGGKAVLQNLSGKG